MILRYILGAGAALVCCLYAIAALFIAVTDGSTGIGFDRYGAKVIFILAPLTTGWTCGLWFAQRMKKLFNFECWFVAISFMMISSLTQNIILLNELFIAPGKFSLGGVLLIKF
jgi:hypothetical protein